MLNSIFISIFLILFFFNIKISKKNKIRQFEENLNLKTPAIQTNLQAKGFELVEIKKPTTKEIWQSYPYNYFVPSIFISGKSVHSLGSPIDFKVIFKNQHGVLCENWLQITENKLNSNINFDWQPSLDNFTHSNEELKY